MIDRTFVEFGELAVVSQTTIFAVSRILNMEMYCLSMSYTIKYKYIQAFLCQENIFGLAFFHYLTFYWLYVDFIKKRKHIGFVPKCYVAAALLLSGVFIAPVFFLFNVLIWQHCEGAQNIHKKKHTKVFFKRKKKYIVCTSSLIRWAPFCMCHSYSHRDIHPLLILDVVSHFVKSLITLSIDTIRIIS